MENTSKIPLLCKLFGHKRRKGWYGTVADGYLELVPFTTDGMGTVHARLFGRCDRCDTRFLVGMTHMPNGYVR